MRFLLIILAFSCLRAQDSNWPQFRGPNGGGVASPGASAPTEFGPAKRLLWKQDLPPGHSSPVVSGDRVFVTAIQKQAKTLELICLAAKTGAILWRHAVSPTEIEETHVVSNPATASPAVDAQRVYVYFSSYGLVALTHAGKVQWDLPLPMPKTHHGSGASPILAGDLLILNHDAMKGGYLLAVNRNTGKEAWRQQYPAAPGRVESYSTPVVWKDQLILHRSGVIESYAAATGERRWTLAESTSGASTPTVSNDIIYVDTWNNLGEDDQRPKLPDYTTLLKEYDKNGDRAISEAEFPDKLIFTARPELENVPDSQNYAAFINLDRNKNGLLEEAEWDIFRARVASMARDHGLLAIRAGGDKPVVVWRENVSIPEVPSPLLYKDRIFLIRNGGVATCLDAGTGKMIYRARVGAPGAYFASPVAVAGHIYLASSEGVVTVLSALGDQLEVLARNRLDDEIVATPAVAGSILFVRTSHILYAFAS